MISSNKGEVKIEGSSADIMSETAQLVTDVIDTIIENTSKPITRKRVLEDINKGIRFYFLLKSGMSPDEAADVMYPKKKA